jgi:hypothetical protein
MFSQVVNRDPDFHSRLEGRRPLGKLDNPVRKKAIGWNSDVRRAAFFGKEPRDLKKIPSNKGLPA